MIAKRESWLYKNPDALASVRRGLKDAAEGRLVSMRRRKEIIKRLKGCLSEKDYRKEIMKLKENRKNWRKNL